MKKRFISLFLVAALCLGLLPTTALADAVVVVPPEGGDGDISVDVTPDEPGNVTVIVPGEDGGDVVVVIPPDEKEPEPPAIGDVVSFAGHEWYIIGTETEGVTAPEGCYTLFAKNNDFGSTAFRTEANGGDMWNSLAYCYKDSDLYNSLAEIANGLSDEEKANIVPRKTLDDIMLKMTNDVVADQLLWPIGANEANNIDLSLRQFDAVYWGRSGDRGSKATDVFITPKPSPGVATPTPTPTPTPTVTPTPEPYSTPKPANNNVFSVYAYNEDGSEREEATAGVLAGWNAEATNVFAVRPALYVKAEAVGAPKVTVPLTGGKVYFGSQDWYIVGMDDVGPVPGPSKTVTLFADSNIEGQYATTSINYSQGDLCTAMKNLEGPLELSDQAAALISSRPLTTTDEITGDPVTTPFWPLSKSEFEAIQAENSSLLMGASWSYWLRTEAPSKWEIHRTVYAGDTDGSLTQNSTPESNFGVRPAFYLDLSTLFFAAGESSMGSSEGGSPVKLMPPGTDSSQKRWNFVMYNSKNLSLSMSAVQGQSGQSLTFQYSGTGGPYHYLAYVLEQDGVPVYYGNAASLKDSGSGTVTVPLLGSSKLEDGDYTMRFYVEDRTDGIYFASNTVDLEICVANGVASITDMREVTVHTHSFGTELKYDENNHWRECACGAKTTPQAHEYSGDQDKTCMYCGYEREVVHQHTLQWLFSSAAGHWQQCIFCNEIMTPVEPHVYDNDQDLTCNVCDYERLPPHTHDFGNSWESDAFGHWQECSCGEKTTAQAHTYDDDQGATCNVCGYERELSHTHDFGTDWESDAFNHWHKCFTCGARDAEAAHTYDSEEDAECNVCGYKRNLSHNHTYTNSWDCDTISHWNECIYCGARSAEAAHVYDNDLDPECNVCKFKREISHVHQGVLVPGTPATCTQEGSKAYYTCTCEQAFEDEACTKPIANLDSWKVIPSKDHTWSESYLAVNADAEKHYHVCTVCNVKDEGEAHTWNVNAATETHDKHCIICGYVAEEQLEHTHTYGTEWKSDATYHWHECSCGEKADEAAHTYGESDTCTICGYVRPAAPEYTVTFNANGGSVSPSSAVTTDGKLTALPIPTRSGYDFVGWYTTASGGQPVSTGTEFTQDTTLYAHWNVREIVSGGGDPSTSGSTTPSQQTMDKIEAAKDGDTVEITLSTGNTELDKEVFEELAGRDVTLEINLPGGVSWTVNGQDIPENATLTDLDMGVSMNTSTIPVNLINMVTGEKGTVQMTLAHDGEFGFAMTLTAPVGTENKGLWANLYHYDTTRKQMLFETAAQVDASGNVALKLSHASEYTIITEGNAAQYYPDYAFNHPLMTEDMRIYSDSKVSDFLSRTTTDQRILFLNEWNEKKDHRERIYISYDSTNKNSQAGDIDLVEFGHPKDDQGKEIFNYSIAYDRNNREPLFYESYPGSIVDISQLQYTLGKAKGYGYRRVGFILDRGYFSKENIRFMDDNGYDFVIMAKGMKKLVSDIILERRGRFEDDRKNSIRAYKVSGTTVRRKLYADDEKERYFHIYYSDSKRQSEREKFEDKIDQMGKKLKDCMGLPVRLRGDFIKYFDLVYWHEGLEDEKFMSGIEKTEIINREIQLCGYFVIVTSDKMTAEEALTLYKSRDGSEKLFRGDKSYLGARSERVYSNESMDTKIFIEFVATIIRSKIYTCLKDEMDRQEHRRNFMTVPAAIKELEKIEMLKGADNEYRLDYAVTARQKEILKAFGLTASNVQKQAAAISSDLARIEVEEFEKAANEQMKTL